MALRLCPTDTQIVFGKESFREIPTREKYYRFRLSDKEKEIIKSNKKKLKDEHDLNISDVMRFFSLHCTDFDLLFDLGLITKHPKVLKRRFEAL